MRNAIVLFLLLLPFGCFSRGIKGVPFLKPTATATLDELVTEINRIGRAPVARAPSRSLVRDGGHIANCRLPLSRPSSIRVNVEAPVLSADIAEIAFDGNRFQLLIHPSGAIRDGRKRFGREA